MTTGKVSQYLAKTSFGFEDILIKELHEIGASEIRKGNRAVYFSGDQAVLYKANLWSRVALRILKPLATFPASTEQQLYDGVKRINWSQFLTKDDSLAVDGVTVRSKLTHSLYIALKSKDAIVDQFREKTGARPDVDLNHPTVRINIHLSSDVATVSLDSSGESLHKRGYRQEQGEAPLNETLAAGMVLLSGWDKKQPLTDLMCGSGTILIEAAMISRNIAPGLFRREFGFQRWNDYNAGLWQEILNEARQKELPRVSTTLTGIDKSNIAIRKAKDNAINAGVMADIDFISMSFEGYTPEISSQMIITNPPYGGRLTDDDLFSLYRTIGDVLKKKFAGSVAWILTANKDASKKIGLHTSAKIQLYNGALECRFLKYDLYSGSKKTSKEEMKHE